MPSCVVNLCTLFDAKYLAKGLALIYSLGQQKTEWHLWVLALDETVWAHFRSHPQTNVTVMPFENLSDTRLEAIQKTRTHREFCWTLGPVWTHAVMRRYDLPSIAYIDADCFLFSDLAPLYQEVNTANVAIIPHRWTPKHANRLRVNGMFNVGWVYFKRSVIGWGCLEQWKDQCLEWCYARNENGKFADQGYLDHWEAEWDAYVVQQLGVNLAPWNQEQYEYATDDFGRGKVYVLQYDRGDRLSRIDPLLFYHFHDWYSPEKRAGYVLHPKVMRYIYEPYERTISHQYELLRGGK